MDYKNITKNVLTGNNVSGDKKIIFNAGIEASLEYANPKSTFVPKIQLIFSPFGLPYVPIEILGNDMNSVIRSFSWTKDKENPGGILQATITPDAKTIQKIVDTINKYSGNLYSKIWGELGVDLEDLFKPMTLCQLWINGYHVCTGTVRSCMRASSVSNEDKQLSYAIIIDELGNMYNMQSTSLDLIIKDSMQTQISDSMLSALSLSANMVGVSLANGLKAILQGFAVSNLTQNVTFSDQLPINMRLLANANPLGGIANSSFATYMLIDSSMFELNGQTIWSFMQSFIPTPWMEFFTDSGGRTIVTEPIGIPSVLMPGFNNIVARSVPYTNPLIGTVGPKELLETVAYDLTVIQMLTGGDVIIITDDMITDKSIGIDSINQYTVFKTHYSSKTMGSNSSDQSVRAIKSSGPLNPFASGGIPTFGIREMNADIDATSVIGNYDSSNYATRIAKTFGIPGKLIAQNTMAQLLCTWFRNQSRFREGSVTTRCMPYARPGMYCLYLPSISGKKPENLRDIGIYYIDSLSHSYGLENEDVSWSTTLNLVRGVPLPATLAQTALLLFDFEILSPMTGMFDGEYTQLKAIRKALSK